MNAVSVKSNGACDATEAFNSVALGSAEPDVWWGEEGIDALLWEESPYEVAVTKVEALDDSVSGKRDMKANPSMRAQALDRIVKSQILTTAQAAQIERVWPNLDGDAFAHPQLRLVAEHTRAFLEHAARGEE